MLEQGEDIEKVKKKFAKKSAYEVAAEMNAETNAPSIDSYGGQNVFLRYKRNEWFESVKMAQLKREQNEKETEILK